MKVKVKVMFFIGFFGIEHKEKEIELINKLQCKNCEHMVSGKMYKTFSCFHFFFVPLVKWSEEYYVKCDRCHRIYRVQTEKGKDIERRLQVDFTYKDLEEVKQEYEYGNHSNSYRVCENCSGKVANEFKYCPYCGKEV